jgi:hypothetical protein
MHSMAGASVAVEVVRSMLMSVSKVQKCRWNVRVEEVQLASEEFGKRPMQNQKTDIQVLPMSRQALAVAEEDVGMESKEQVAVLSNGVVDIQGIHV